MSIPNKVLDYLSLGLPIISPLKGVTQQLINEKRVGSTYIEGDVDSLFATLEKYDLKRDLVSEESINCIDLFQQNYEAEKIYNKAILSLNNLLCND